MISKTLYSAFFILVLWFSPLFAEPDIEHLSPQDIKRVDSILKRLDPVVGQKKTEGKLPTLSYEELYFSLSEEEKGFLREIQALSPQAVGIKTPYLGISEKDPELVRLEKQVFLKNGKLNDLEIQYLPRDVYESYEKMMKAMEKDLGKRLYVESGYRSPAYQLYLFMFYLAKHGYSIHETARFNALPGYSEHGYPDRQAIDFISREGVSGEEKPESFEGLTEYRWLLEHARSHHFYLSYPKNNPVGITFEPWHWHYEKGGKE